MAKGICSVEGCGKPHRAHGWCNMHNIRWRKFGTTDKPPRNPAPVRACSVTSCNHPARKRDWCGTHYARWLSQGDVQADVPIREYPNRGNECSADDCDRAARARGWCQKHYRRWQANGDLTLRRQVTSDCSMTGCDRPHVALGLCGLHWDRQHMAKRRAPFVVPPSLPGERWLPIPGHVGVYEVSDLGRVRSMTRTITHADGNESTYRGKLLRLQVSKAGGYHLVRLSVNSVGESMHIHRAVMEAFVGPRPEGLQICHGDGDPTNNRLGNLRFDTPSANQHDKVRHGRHHNTNKPACPQDHLYQMPNLTSWGISRGIRRCRTCALTDSARRKAAKAGLPFDPYAYAEQKYRELMEPPHDPGRVAP